MLYSSKYKAIVYHENGDPYLNQVVYQSIDGNVLKDKFSILVDTNNIEKNHIIHYMRIVKRNCQNLNMMHI